MFVSQHSVHHALLEEDVESRLRDLLSPSAHLRYETRRLKGAAFPGASILIQARRRLRRHSSSYRSPDALAFLLSQISLNMPLPGLSRIRHILLLPEFIQNGAYCLSHLYSTRSSVLAIYLYPKRLDALSEGSALAPPKSRLSPSPEGRLAHLFSENEPSVHSRSILAQVLRDLGGLSEKEALHSWIYPLSEIREGEKIELQKTHELYGGS